MIENGRQNFATGRNAMGKPSPGPNDKRQQPDKHHRAGDGVAATHQPGDERDIQPPMTPLQKTWIPLRRQPRPQCASSQLQIQDEEPRSHRDSANRKAPRTLLGRTMAHKRNVFRPWRRSASIARRDYRVFSVKS